MQTKKIIKYVYIALTIYVFYVIDVTTLTFIDLLPAVVLMWFMYFIFSFSSKTRISQKVSFEEDRKNLFDNNYFIIASIILLIISINYAMKFYVGLDLRKFINLFISKNYNFYQQYQLHHKNAGIGIFSLEKIPYILMLFYIKIMFLTTTIEFLYLRNKRNYKSYLLMGVATLAHLMFGLARGTNFEFFELLLLIFFIYFNKGQKIKTTKAKLVISTVTIVLAVLFYNRIAVRSGSISFASRHEYSINENSFLIQIFGNNITGLLFFYDYFIFGFYYTSRFLTEIIFTDLKNVFILLIPNGHKALANINITELMLQIAPRNTRWHPNIVLFFLNLGTIG